MPFELFWLQRVAVGNRVLANQALNGVWGIVEPISYNTLQDEAVSADIVKPAIDALKVD
jgi:hypothetical protein